MKRVPIKIFQIIAILIAVGVSFIPHVSSAAGWLEGPAVSVVNTAISIVANWVLGLTSTLVVVAGTFLSISINLTTHIGDFYNSIPALNDVWVVVRNISSMFIIFALLYTSISTILGVGKSVKELIGKIIIVGLLINFSLFFCKILIDASNLVSLQFYRAIAPQYQVDGLSKVSSAYYDGGLSNVFMNSLKIPKIYQNQNVLKSADVTLSISFATVGGVIMMVTAAISFFAAAIAFTIRTGLLLFVMALSPLYFASMIFPQAKEKADELMKLFKGQLIFMPAYLFLMYIALRLISSPGFSSIFNQSATGIAAPNEGAFGPTFVGIIIQYVIALFFINAPLLMAIKMGASGAGWAPDMNKVAGLLRKNTISRAASKISDSEALKNYAARSKVGEYTLKGIRGAAADYNLQLDKQVSARTKFADSLGHDQGVMNSAQSNLRNLSAQLAQAQATNAPNVGTLKGQVSAAKRTIKDIENTRKTQYADRTDSRSIDTLYSKVARKDKVAAAKLQISIVEDQLTRHKEDLKDTKAEIKSLQNAITNNAGGAGATQAQNQKMQQLLADQANHTNNVNTQEALLDSLRLIK